MISAATPTRFRRWVRLNNTRQFRRVFERAVRSSDQAFTVLARQNSCEHARLGLAISRKCAKNAVARNRIKRLVRESFRLAQHKLPAVDIIVMCQPLVNTMTNKELAAVLRAHWRRLIQQCTSS
ncbi:MAG TPA: ribonuclease P protein component [Gammaproteobacteria bacterium]|nr:ribonuclease P protein component [Gammaproteobacteria bacterium]HKH19326.1 ribonuclease P protein component [Gammaproteobacteria bacterium]